MNSNKKNKSLEKKVLDWARGSPDHKGVLERCAALDFCKNLSLLFEPGESIQIKNDFGLPGFTGRQNRTELELLFLMLLS